MFTHELVRKLRVYAKEHGLHFEIVKHRGKGGHQMIYVGDRKTTIPSSSKELKTGTLRAIMKQLSVDKL